jgi:mono/diheme cytochrome c family protein
MWSSKKSTMFGVTVLATAFLIAACAPSEPPAGAALEGTAGEGAMFFVENCSGCHGTNGKGNGPDAAGLDPRPADLTQIAARNGGMFPSNWVMSTIHGFHRDAPSGSAMPAFGQVGLGPTTVVELSEGIGTPIPVMLLALEQYLKSIQE